MLDPFRKLLDTTLKLFERICLPLRSINELLAEASGSAFSTFIKNQSHGLFVRAVSEESIDLRVDLMDNLFEKSIEGIDLVVIEGVCD